MGSSGSFWASPPPIIDYGGASMMPSNASTSSSYYSSLDYPLYTPTLQLVTSSNNPLIQVSGRSGGATGHATSQPIPSHHTAHQPIRSRSIRHPIDQSSPGYRLPGCSGCS